MTASPASVSAPARALTSTDIAALEAAIKRNLGIVTATNVRREAIVQAQAALTEASDLFNLAVEVGDLAEAEKYGAQLPGLRKVVAGLPQPDEAAAALASRQIATARRRIADSAAAVAQAKAPLSVKAFAGLAKLVGAKAA